MKLRRKSDGSPSHRFGLMKDNSWSLSLHASGQGEMPRQSELASFLAFIFVLFLLLLRLSLPSRSSSYLTIDTSRHNNARMEREREREGTASLPATGLASRSGQATWAGLGWTGLD